MRRSTLVMLLCLTWVSVSSFALAGAKKAAPPQSTAFGKSLTQWMVEYWTQYFEGGDGFVKRVRLLPQPEGQVTGGSSTFSDPVVIEGELDVTLEPGTPFVLPISTFVGETYLPELNIPDDVPVADAVFTDSDVLVTLDGRALINSEIDDLSDYYFGPAYFNEPILFTEPSSNGSIGAIFVQGLGFVQSPLPVGEHVLTLHSEILIEDLNAGAVFDYTWYITVEP